MAKIDKNSGAAPWINDGEALGKVKGSKRRAREASRNSSGGLTTPQVGQQMPPTHVRREN